LVLVEGQLREFDLSVLVGNLTSEEVLTVVGVELHSSAGNFVSGFFITDNYVYVGVLELLSGPTLTECGSGETDTSLSVLGEKEKFFSGGGVSGVAWNGEDLVHWEIVVGSVIQVNVHSNLVSDWSWNGRVKGRSF